MSSTFQQLASLERASSKGGVSLLGEKGEAPLWCLAFSIFSFDGGHGMASSSPRRQLPQLVRHVLEKGQHDTRQPLGPWPHLVAEGFLPLLAVCLRPFVIVIFG